MRRPGQGGGAEPNDRGSIAPKSARPQYLDEWTGEFVVTNASPPGPCRCGDRVFYQLHGDIGWRCRSCRSPGHAGWRTVMCRHDPQCDPPEHIRTAILRWFCVGREPAP